MQPKSSSMHAPFKGESFPSYVMQRVSRHATGSSALQQAGPASSSIVATNTSTVAVPPSSSSVELSKAKVSTPNSSSPSCRTPTQRKVPASDSPVSSTTRTRSLQRPSLSDQLKTISQGAEAITTKLKTTYKLQNAPSPSCIPNTLPTALLQTTTIGMSVGKLACRFPCPVQFAQDHCSYLFQHPYETKEVQMIMYYRDMTHVRVNLREKCFQFRINHPLEHFGDDYRPANPQHAIKIVLATSSEARNVQQFLAEHKLWFPQQNIK